MKSITLYYREGSSDKVYQAAVEPKDSRFIVTFAYGRRGGALQSGVKTPEPVDLEDAERVFDKLVREKTAKGYTPGESGASFAGTDKAESDSGLRPQLLNAIDKAEALKLAGDPQWCMQEKLDGRRLLVKKEGDAIVGVNRKGLVVPLPSPIVQSLEKIDGDFVLDGEWVGETFHAFDLIALGEDVCRECPYAERLRSLKSLLQNRLSRNLFLVETYGEEDMKRSRLKALEARRAEGAVFKLLSAPYAPGRPASGGPALKYKFTATGSFIVAELNQRRSVSLRLFQEEQPCGNVAIPPNYPLPKPGDVVEVRYLHAFRGGSLYQPVYLGVRDDMDPADCLPGQIKFKPEEDGEDREG
jgi:bifunctional non-homologous end joining protein LigD